MGIMVICKLKLPFWFSQSSWNNFMMPLFHMKKSFFIFTQPGAVSGSFMFEKKTPGGKVSLRLQPFFPFSLINNFSVDQKIVLLIIFLHVTRSRLKSLNEASQLEKLFVYCYVEAVAEKHKTFQMRVNGKGGEKKHLDIFSSWNSYDTFCVRLTIVTWDDAKEWQTDRQAR